MSEENLMDLSYRKQILQETKGTENEQRLNQSVEEWEVYVGNIAPYVVETLETKFSAETVKEMPVVSAVNLLRKVVNSRASLYTREPERMFTDLSEDQEQTIHLTYKDLRANFTFLESNRLYELQKHQTHMLIEPKKGKLIARPIKAHQVNVVPNDLDPEEGEIYIFSGYSRDLHQARNKAQDGINQEIGDYDDRDLSQERYVVWSKSYHFTMDGNGEILTENIDNPLGGVIPVVEIAAMKDFAYWREITNDVARFCVDYNVSLSSLAYIVEMQGFAQAYLKAPEDLMPSYVEVGPNKILKLITNPNMEGDVEFGFANPGSDIGGAQAFTESLLAQFLSAQGLDNKTVSGSASADSFNSGIERLLAQIEKFEASKETMAIYRDAENDFYQIIKTYHNSLKGSGLLLPKYETADYPEQSEVVVEYIEPQSVTSELEKLEVIERKVDLGVIDRVGALADLDGLTREQAEERIAKMEMVDNAPIA